MNSGRTTALSGSWDVSRKIKIPSLLNATNAKVINNRLSQLTGVLAVIADVEKHQVTIRYDTSEIVYLDIANLLENIGYPVLNNKWSRFKKSLYQFLDTNAKENANAPSRPCCNKPPK